MSMGHDKKEKLHKGLPTHKISEGDGAAAQMCKGCNSYTKYDGRCVICQVPPEDEYLKYIGTYGPYERLLKVK